MLIKNHICNSISNYIEPKGKLNTDSSTNHSEMKYRISKRQGNCLKLKNEDLLWN